MGRGCKIICTFTEIENWPVKQDFKERKKTDKWIRF